MPLHWCWSLLVSSTIEVEVRAQSLTASAATANASKVAPRALYPKPSLTRSKVEMLKRFRAERLVAVPPEHSEAELQLFAGS
jgi:hypothetical protein